MGSVATGASRLTQADRSALSERRTLEPALQGRTGVDALLAFADAHTQFADENPVMTRALYVLWFQSLISDSPTRDAAIEDLLGHRDRIRRIIEQGISAGTIRPDADANAEAIEFCGTLFGLGLQWLIDPIGSRIENMHQRFKERLGAKLRP